MALLHHYTFSEKNDNLYDMTANNFHLKKINTNPSAEARWGTKSLRMYESEIKNESGNLSKFYSNSFSICAWLKYSILGSGQELISGDSGYVQITLEVNSSGAINFGLGKGNDTETLSFFTQTPPNLVRTNQWLNIIAIWDKSNSISRIYLDGIQVGFNEFSFTPSIVYDQWKIGKRYDSTKAFNGNLNDLKIFNHALSAEEVRKYGNSSALEIRSDRAYMWEIDETKDSLSPAGVFGAVADITEEDISPERLTWGLNGFKTIEVKEGF